MKSDNSFSQCVSKYLLRPDRLERHLELLGLGVPEGLAAIEEQFDLQLASIQEGILIEDWTTVGEALGDLNDLAGEIGSDVVKRSTADFLMVVCRRQRADDLLLQWRKLVKSVSITEQAMTGWCNQYQPQPQAS